MSSSVFEVRREGKETDHFREAEGSGGVSMVSVEKDSDVDVDQVGGVERPTDATDQGRCQRAEDDVGMYGQQYVDAEYRTG